LGLSSLTLSRLLQGSGRGRGRHRLRRHTRRACPSSGQGPHEAQQAENSLHVLSDAAALNGAGHRLAGARTSELASKIQAPAPARRLDSEKGPKSGVTWSQRERLFYNSRMGVTNRRVCPPSNVRQSPLRLPCISALQMFHHSNVRRSCMVKRSDFRT
jgi:hypothetical protein